VIERVLFSPADPFDGVDALHLVAAHGALTEQVLEELICAAIRDGDAAMAKRYDRIARYLQRHR